MLLLNKAIVVDSNNLRSATLNSSVCLSQSKDSMSDVIKSIRFLYLADSNKESYISAVTKVIDPNVNAANALEYLVKKFPLRQNIALIEITPD